MNELGLIHIYCGDGKGKTSAALGLAVRALGRGIHVLFVQFLKGGESGEVSFFEKTDNVVILKSDKRLPFVFKMTETEKEQSRKINRELLENAISLASNKGEKVVILDEIIHAYNNSLIDRDKLIAFLQDSPKDTEIVLTGRNPDEKLIECADYISEIKKIKHPFDSGIRAREGIEL